MNKFWPKDLDLSDCSSPEEILLEAKGDWERGSNGLLALQVQAHEIRFRQRETEIIAEKTSNKNRIALFSIIQVPNEAYPVTISFPENRLPHLLRDTIFEEGLADREETLSNDDIHGKMVENEWLSITPLQFRTKLSKAFNSSVIKSRLQNLLLSK